ncbi:MAG: insulinase family protein [Acidimicrobiia bacterium]|nr:insulinase family protein [Acidimicrobiia bacterium]
MRGLTATKLEAFRKKYYTARNIVVSVVGRVNPAEDMKIISKYFGEVPAGSVVSLPAGEWRDVRNPKGGPAEFVIASNGDGRCPIEWSPTLVKAARDLGYVLDASGCVAPRELVERHFG